MRGLVEYEDDAQSDSDAKMPNAISNDKASKANPKVPSDARKFVIRRPATQKPSRRLHGPDDGATDDPAPIAGPSGDSDDSPRPTRSTSAVSTPFDDLTIDELPRIRKLLKPPPIDGLEDWGIPPAPEGECSPELQAKLAQFSQLKHHPTNPRHFNDTLMSNRSFRNPHLYAKLVEFVDVDERATNFPSDIWNPFDVKPEWYAGQLADAQKVQSDKLSASQASGKRTRVDFVKPREKDPPPPPAKKSRFGGYSSSYPHGTSAQPHAHIYSSSGRDYPKSRMG